MKDTIRKILIEENQFKKAMYYKKVARMIVDDIDIDHKSHVITIPFISPWGNRKGYFVGDGLIDYNLEYDKDYLLMPEIHTYLQKYGLQPRRGILMVINKLIEKGIQERIDNSSSPLTESKKGKKKFIDIVVDELVGDTILKWEDERGDRSPIHVPWSNNKNRITFNFFIDTLTHPFVWENSIKKYIMSTYAVPDEMVKTIWGNYKKNMFSKYKKYIETFKGYKNLTEKGWKSLTESDNKKEKYYQHVIKDMIRRTTYEIDSQNESNLMIIFAMYGTDDRFVFNKFFIDKHTWNTVSDEDVDFLTHTYGIRESECVIVMTRYWETLKPLLHSLWDY